MVCGMGMGFVPWSGSGGEVRRLGGRRKGRGIVPVWGVLCNAAVPQRADGIGGNVMKMDIRGVSRRGVVAGAGARAAFGARAQTRPDMVATPPSVISNPPRQWGSGAPPEIYPDPDIIVID